MQCVVHVENPPDSG
jgi:hypothetical protein